MPAVTVICNSWQPEWQSSSSISLRRRQPLNYPNRLPFFIANLSKKGDFANFRFCHIINFYLFALFVKIRWVSLNKAFFSVCSSRSDIRNTNVARSISFTGIVSHSWSIFNDGYLRKNVFKNLKDFYKLKYFLKTRFVLK